MLIQRKRKGTLMLMVKVGSSGRVRITGAGLGFYNEQMEAGVGQSGVFRGWGRRPQCTQPCARDGSPAGGFCHLGLEIL